MKDFQLQLNYPPQGVYYPGMTVTGTVFAVNDEPKDYKAIKVRIVGFAHVHWSESTVSEYSGRRQTRHYSARVGYLNTFIRIWDKDTSAGGGQFPAGSYQYPFSLKLIGNNLPASYEGTVGKIKYTVEARVIKDGLLKRDTVRKTTIKIANVVEINRPDLLQPKSMEVQKTLCCLCCASGPIVIIARIPRTGYCIHQDSIPVEVSMENGSSREIRQVVASIHKLVDYTAEYHYRQDRLDVATIASEPVPAHNTTVWKPPPLAVPDTPTTSINCGILQVNYFLRVKAAISWAINPTVDIPIVLGNVPLPGTEAGPQPIILPPQQGLEPHPPLGFVPPPQPQPGGIPYAIPPQPMPQPYPPPASIPLNPFPAPHPRYDQKSLNQLRPGFVDPIKKI